MLKSNWNVGPMHLKETPTVKVNVPWPRMSVGIRKLGKVTVLCVTARTVATHECAIVPLRKVGGVK